MPSDESKPDRNKPPRPALTAAEIERRVVAYLKGKPRASRQEWSRLGPHGMR